MLDIQEPMKQVAEQELSAFKARPGGYTFQIMLQNRFIEKQRQLLDAYDAAADNNEKQNIRRQLVAVDAQVKQKNDEIAALERQMRPLRPVWSQNVKLLFCIFHFQHSVTQIQKLLIQSSN